MKATIAVLLCLSASADAFTSPSVFAAVKTISSSSSSTRGSASAVFAQQQEESNRLEEFDFSKMAVSTASIWAASASMASADSPDWGIFEGKTLSLLHPLMMGSLLLFSLSTAILGFQWRRQRTLGDEISALKKTLPAVAESTDDASRVRTLQIESQINELTQERKELAAAGPKDKHFSQGSLLALLGTAFAIEGPLNTYARAGKLFPGPHLYAGAGLVVLWALAAACVPAMQKGNDTARTVHIGANAAGIGFFIWQVVSGVPILFKVWEKTQWP